MGPTEIYIPITEWPTLYKWPTINGMRNRFADRKTNGYESAFLKDGDRVIVKVNEFWLCLEKKNKKEE